MLVRQVQLVSQLVLRQNLKDACRVVADHGLHEAFPGIELLYQECTLEKLMGRQRWPAALQVTHDNRALQAGTPIPL
jgi:hypothetical protein